MKFINKNSINILTKSGYLVFMFVVAVGGVTVNAHKSQANTLGVVDASGSDQAQKQNKIQLPWVENRGVDNTPEELSFSSELQGGEVVVDKNGVSYTLPTYNTCEGVEVDTCIKNIELREKFIGSEYVNLQAGDKSKIVVTKFIGPDANAFTTYPKAYTDVWAKSVWNGVSVDLKSYQKNVEKIFKVSPISSPSKISIGIKGATNLTIDAETGELVVSTSAGEVRMSKPVAYQFDFFGRKSFVDVSYIINKTEDTMSYGFAVPKYSHFLNLYIN